MEGQEVGSSRCKYGPSGGGMQSVQVWTVRWWDAVGAAHWHVALDRSLLRSAHLARWNACIWRGAPAAASRARLQDAAHNELAPLQPLSSPPLPFRPNNA
eukprot:208170-Chlamydomonas_euryale.AAC.2